MVTTTHEPGETHLTGSEQASNTMVQWHSFDEMVRLINVQEFDRVQAKYLKVRDMASLQEYAAWRSKAKKCIAINKEKKYSIDVKTACFRAENWLFWSEWNYRT